MPTPQGKFWCWTLNNPTTEEIEALKLIQLIAPEIQYLIFQLEQGQQQTPHLQGYLELTSRKTRNQVKSLLSNDRLHLERRRGTAQEAATYCKKEDGRLEGPWEFGDSPSDVSTRGQRSDLTTIRERITAGRNEREIADEFFAAWCQYHNAFRRYRNLCFSHRDWKTRTIVIVGPPGTGKSRWAMDQYPTAYWKQRSQWWCGYEGHDSVILDDFYGWLPYDQILRMCDRYPLQVETKGGQVTFLAKNVVFTSNQHPRKWYNSERIDLAAFTRRVDVFMYYGEHGMKLETESYDRFTDAYDRNYGIIEM